MLIIIVFTFVELFLFICSVGSTHLCTEMVRC